MNQQALDFLSGTSSQYSKTAKDIEMEKVVLSKDIVELVMTEFEISKQQAERVLRENLGNLDATLNQLVGIV